MFYQSFFSEICLKLSMNFPWNQLIFNVNLSLKILQNLTYFSATYEKPCPIKDHCSICTPRLGAGLWVGVGGVNFISARQVGTLNVIIMTCMITGRYIILNVNQTWFFCTCKVLSADGQNQVGKISKQWSGLAKEMFTDADNFGITCKSSSISNRLFSIT